MSNAAGFVAILVALGGWYAYDTHPEWLPQMTRFCPDNVEVVCMKCHDPKKTEECK